MCSIEVSPQTGHNFATFSSRDVLASVFKFFLQTNLGSRARGGLRACSYSRRREPRLCNEGLGDEDLE
jgi:hypothetical protein